MAELHLERLNSGGSSNVSNQPSQKTSNSGGLHLERLNPASAQATPARTAYSTAAQMGSTGTHEYVRGRRNIDAVKKATSGRMTNSGTRRQFIDKQLVRQNELEQLIAGSSFSGVQNLINQYKDIASKTSSLSSKMRDIERMNPYDAGLAGGTYQANINKYTEQAARLQKELERFGITVNGAAVDSSRYNQIYFDSLKPNAGLAAAEYIPANGLLKDNTTLNVEEYLNHVGADEMQLYNYLASSNPEEADVYRQYLDNLVQQRIGGERTEQILDKYTAGGVALSRGTEAFKSGVAGAYNAMVATATGNDKKTSASEYAAEQLRADLASKGDEWWRTAGFDIMQSIGTMTPGVVAGMVNPNAGMAVFGATTGTMAYQEKLAEGWSADEARRYGLMVGTSEAALGKLLGGIPALGGAEGGLLAKLTGNVNNALAKIVLNRVGEMGSEALEEGLQTIIAPAIESAVRGTPYDMPELKEIAYSAVLGAITSAGFGAPSFVAESADAVSPYTANKQNQYRYGADAQTLVNEAKQIKDIKPTVDRAQKRLDKGKSISNATAKKLTTTANRSRVVDAVETQINVRAGEIDEKTSRSLANAIVAKTRNEGLTQNQQKLIAKHEKLASTLEKELDPKKPAEWAQTIGVRGAEEASYGSRNVANAVEAVENKVLASGEYAEAKKNLINKGQDKIEFSEDFEYVAEVHGNTRNYESFDEVWNAIKDDTVLTEDQARTAWQKGKEKLQAAGTSARLTRRGTGKVSFGELEDGDVTYTAPEQDEIDSFKRGARYQYLEALAKKVGVDIVFFKAGDEGINGKYLNGTVYLAIDASPTSQQSVEGYVMLTAAHELTHYIKEASPARYAELKDFVIKHIVDKGKLEDKNLKQLIMDKRNAYARAGVELSVDAAIEEIVADACEMMLKDNTLVAQLRDENDTLYGSVKDWLKRFMRVVRKAFEGLKGAHHVEAKAMEDRFKELQRIWNLGLTEAAQAEVMGESNSGESKYSFAGRKSETANQSRYQKAVDMEKAGKDSETIRKQTGWFKGMDGQWRYEIDDGSAEFLLPQLVEKLNAKVQAKIDKIEADYKAGKFGRQAYLNRIYTARNRFQTARWDFFHNTHTVGELLKHPKLYAAYPFIKDVTVSFSEMPSHLLGIAGENEITLPEWSYDKPNEIAETLAHEIQHIIQDYEGFAIGSSVKYWQRRIDNGYAEEQKAKAVAEADKKYKELWNSAPTELKNKMREINRAKLAKDWDVVVELEEAIYDSEYADEYSAIDAADFDRRDAMERDYERSANDLYYQTAGEIEARDTAARLALTAEQRKNTRPDIDQEDVVFIEAAYARDMSGGKYSLKEVAPVQPTSNEWSRTSTTSEAMNVYPRLWNVAAEESETRNPTQIVSTQGTYRKIYDILKKQNFDGKILDASSGMGIGTRIGRAEYGFDVDDIEPYPDRAYKPKYTDYSKLNKKYDVIISSAVLNVLPQDQRDALVVKMGELLNPGGKMYITTRGRDVDSLANTGKNIRLGNMEWIETVKGSYQKGFTQNELAAYLKDALGAEFSVEKSNASNGGRFNNNTSIVVTKHDDSVKKSIKDYSWARENGIIDSEQQRVLDEAVERISRGYKGFPTTYAGERIVDYDNILMFVGGTYEEPRLTRVITFDMWVSLDIDYAKEIMIYGEETSSRAADQSAETIENLFGVGSITQYNGRDYSTNAGQARRGKGTNGRRSRRTPSIRESIEAQGYKFDPELGDYVAPDGSLFSERKLSIKDDAQSDRMLLANALMSVAQNDAERRRLNNYKKQIDTIEGIQALLYDKENELSRAYRAKDKAEIAKVQRERDALREKLIRADSKLTELQATKPLKDLLKRVRQDTRRRTQISRRETRSKAELRNKIKTLHKQMSNQLLKPSENKYVPKPLLRTVAELLEEINLDSGRSEKIKAKLTELSGQYKKIAESNESYVYDPVIAEMIANLQSTIATMDDSSIYHMSRENLQMVYDTMKAINHTVRNAVKMIGYEENRNIFELAKAMIHETTRTNPVANKLANKYINATLRPDVFFKRMGGYVKNSVWQMMGDMLNAAQLRQLQIQMEGAAFFEELMREEDKLKEMCSPDRLIDIGLKDEFGETVRVTMDIALKIYMDTMAEDNARHLMYGGYTVPNMREYYKGKPSEAFDLGSVSVRGFGPLFHELEYNLRHAETEEEAAEIQQKIEQAEADAADWVEKLRQNIREQMGEYELRWVEAAERFFNEYSQRVLNETTMAVYGFAKATVPYYVPIHTDAAYRQANFESISRDFSLENSGFMKQRVKASNPMMAEGLVDVVSGQIDRVAKYAGMMPGIRNFEKVYGKSTGGFENSVQRAVGTKFGKDARKYIENLITDLTAPRRTEGGMLGEFADQLRGKLASAALTLNPRVTLEQFTSYPKAAAVIGYEPLLKALRDVRDNPVLSEQARQEIAQWSPLMWYRTQGLFNREMGDIRGDDILKRKTGKAMDFLLKSLEFTEGATVGQMWYAAQYYVEDNTSLERGTDAFMQETAKVFNRIVMQTQANYTTMQRPDILRNPNAIVKQLTMFMTERLQNANMVFDAVGTYNAYLRDFKNGANDVTAEDLREAKLGVARTASSLIAATASSVALKLIVDAIMYNMKGYRDEDEELTMASVNAQLLENFFESVAGNFLWGSEIFAVMRSVITGETYYGISLGGVENFTDAVDAVVKAAQEPSKESLWKLAKSAAQMLGIPANNAIKIYNSYAYRIKDVQEGNGWGTYASEVKMTDEKRNKQLYEALLAGNQPKIDRLFEHYGTEAAADAALAKHIKSLYMSDELSEKEAIAQLEELASMSAYDAKLTIDKLRFEKEQGFAYEDMKQQYLEGIITGEDAVKFMVDYGDVDKSTAESDVNQWRMEKETGLVYSKVSSYLASGDIDDTTAIKYLMNYGGYDSEEAAAKKVSEWMGEIETGIPADKVEEYYAEGLISRDFLINYYMNYKWWYTEEYANQVADKRDFIGTDERLDDISVAAVQTYNEVLADAGVDKVTYRDTWKFCNTVYADKDANGKSIQYSAMDKKLEYINSLNLEPWQKTLLAIANDISEKNVKKRAPWA